METGLTEKHRNIVAPVLFQMVCPDVFLKFLAAANFTLCAWCRDSVRRLREEILEGLSGIRLHGLLLPPFCQLVRPSIAFDPVLVTHPVRYFQRFWQIEGRRSCLAGILQHHGYDPRRILEQENKSPRFPSHLSSVADSIDFLQGQCRCMELACWEAVKSGVLPWPLQALYPRMPHREGMTVDYAIIYFKYKTLGVALCF